jgi:hypothetical protein
VYFHEHEPEFARPLLLRFNYCGIFPLQSCHFRNGKCKIHYIQYQKHAGCLTTQMCFGCTSQCFAAFHLIHFPHKSIGYSSRLFLFPVLLICLFWMLFLHPFKQQSFMDLIDPSEIAVIKPNGDHKQ